MKRNFGALAKDSTYCFFKLMLVVFAATMVLGIVVNNIVKLITTDGFSQDIALFVFQIILEAIFIWIAFKRDWINKEKSLIYNLIPSFIAVAIQLIICFILGFYPFYAGQGVFELASFVTKIQINNLDHVIIQPSDIPLGINLLSFAVFTLVRVGSLIFTYYYSKKSKI